VPDSGNCARTEDDRICVRVGREVSGFGDGSMTERLEVHVNCLSVGGPRLALHDTEQRLWRKPEAPDS
jgi:hypothetical protein